MNDVVISEKELAALRQDLAEYKSALDDAAEWAADGLAKCNCPWKDGTMGADDAWCNAQTSGEYATLTGRCDCPREFEQRKACFVNMWRERSEGRE